MPRTLHDIQTRLDEGWRVTWATLGFFDLYMVIVDIYFWRNSKPLPKVVGSVPYVPLKKISPRKAYWVDRRLADSIIYLLRLSWDAEFLGGLHD